MAEGRTQDCLQRSLVSYEQSTFISVDKGEEGMGKSMAAWKEADRGRLYHESPAKYGLI